MLNVIEWGGRGEEGGTDLYVPSGTGMVTSHLNVLLIMPLFILVCM